MLANTFFVLFCFVFLFIGLFFGFSYFRSKGSGGLIHYCVCDRGKLTNVSKKRLWNSCGRNTASWLAWSITKTSFFTVVIVVIVSISISIILLYIVPKYVWQHMSANSYGRRSLCF